MRKEGPLEKTTMIARGRRATLIALLTTVALLAAGRAGTAPGDLDPTFGTGGLVTTDFFGGGDAARALVQQDDGKLVAAGFSAAAAGAGDFALARYETDGSLDPTFGIGGVVTTDLGGDDEVFGIAVQDDGKLVAAGRSTAGGDADFALARYGTDGSLDPAFGTGGLVTTDVGGVDFARGLVLQEDGKAVAAGGTFDGSDFALVRYGTDGSLDASFGTGGIVSTDFGGDDDAYALALQEDGKLVAAGDAFLGLGERVFALARYETDGSLDPTFGTGGLVTTELQGGDRVYDLVVQDDGKLVAAGDAVAGLGGDLTEDSALVRYQIDGSLDPAFGTGGVVMTDFGGNDRIHALDLQDDGLLVAAGFSFAGDELVVARYGTGGTLDPDFGTGGLVTTDFAGFDDRAHALTLQDDGKIVAAGLTFAGFLSDTDFALARYETRETVEVLIDRVGDLPDGVFAAPGHRTATLSRLETIRSRIEDGETRVALAQLRNLRRRFDGCPPTADRDDWIVDCAAQLEVRALIDRMIAELESA